MQTVETATFKLLRPNKAKQIWLYHMSGKFNRAVTSGIELLRTQKITSHHIAHKKLYKDFRKLLPATYARVAINQSVAAARMDEVAFRGLGFGVGTNAYKIFKRGSRYVLRLSTGRRGYYLWLPLMIPEKFRTIIGRLANSGDGNIFFRCNNWFFRTSMKSNAVERSNVLGEIEFIGVDFGTRRLITVVSPDEVKIVKGPPLYYQRNRRCGMRKIRWEINANHGLARVIVQLADQYDNPIIVLKQFYGLQYNCRSSARFNRISAVWNFKQLADLIKQKARKLGISVMLVNPKRINRICNRCGYCVPRAIRSVKGGVRHTKTFRCKKCDYEVNSGVNTARNLRAAGLNAWSSGSPGTTC